MKDKRLFRYHLWVPTHKKYEIVAHSEIEARNILDEDEDMAPYYFISEERIEGLNTVVERGKEVETCVHGHNQEIRRCSDCGTCLDCIDEKYTSPKCPLCIK